MQHCALNPSKKHIYKSQNMQICILKQYFRIRMLRKRPGGIYKYLKNEIGLRSSTFKHTYLEIFSILAKYFIVLHNYNTSYIFLANLVFLESSEKAFAKEKSVHSGTTLTFLHVVLI